MHAHLLEKSALENLAGATSYDFSSKLESNFGRAINKTKGISVVELVLVELVEVCSKNVKKKSSSEFLQITQESSANMKMSRDFSANFREKCSANFFGELFRTFSANFFGEFFRTFSANSSEIKRKFSENIQNNAGCADIFRKNIRKFSK